MELDIIPPKIYFDQNADPADLNRMGNNISFDGRRRRYWTLFTPQNLILIKQTYPKAYIQNGQEFVDEMKHLSRNIEMGKKNPPLFPRWKEETVLPFRLKPFDHQWEGIHYLSMFDGGAVFAECGVGKTLITLGDIMLKYKQGSIRPSSVLVVSKLMTLFSGWQSDANKFTDLASTVLWEPSNTKIEKGEAEHVTNYGPKPSKGKSKTFTKTCYF